MKKKIGNILPPVDKCNLGFKNFAAFTLAEILLSLTVIGIVAAIALPSLLGNANERAWETQKKALYTRFSQALPLLPSLNGYGQLEEVTNGNDTQIIDTAAETFVRDGLSKVIKITNICDSEHLADCGLPDKIIPINNGSAINLSSMNLLSGFNESMTSSTLMLNGSVDAHYEQTDTKAVAFETVNGESILAYYNPNCKANLYDDGSSWQFSQPKMCANFVYDLNGKKGPNSVGKDIGFITALYSTDPVVVMPDAQSKYIAENYNFDDTQARCRGLNDMKLPTIDELTSIFYNKKLLNLPDKQYWSSTSNSPDKIWVQDTGFGRQKVAFRDNTEAYKMTLCVKR